jgi:transcriptional regulator with XRE-family HTH domain
MATLNVGNLGEYLREQRRNAQLSLRQLADAAGVSNPYLSQIERGLRKPSAEVLQQVAKALRISAETLYVRAGILDAERDRDEVETRAVIVADPTLNERQKQVLLQIYESFRKENGFGTGPETPEADSPGDGAVDVQERQEQADGTGDGDGTAERRTRKARSTRKSNTEDEADAGTDAGTASGRKAAAPRRTRTNRTTRKTGGSDADPQQSAG